MGNVRSENDPNELNNLFGKPEFANKQAELMSLLKETQKLYQDNNPREEEIAQ